MGKTILKMEGISKSFAGVQALKNAGLELKSSEVLALMGENGAGKSTLMKILTGIHKKDSGIITYMGKEVEFNSTAESEEHGIVIVHQELNMLKDLTVAQNLFMGKEIMNGIFIDDSGLNKKAKEVFEDLNVNINPREIMDRLTVGEQQLEHLVEEKLSEDIKQVGTRAGYLTDSMARQLGLNTSTAVAVGIIDAHSSVPACKIDEPGKMLMVMGTSTCHLLLNDEEKLVPGSAGIVKDGILPGFFGYEAGQSCVGDHFDWFVNNCVPADYEKEAKAEKLDMHQYLTKKANKLQVGESGLLALDWWNGVRSTLMNSKLTGLILGMTLQTKPEEIYRALIEATAYGTRQIIETFEDAGVLVNELYAAGGIASKNSMMMQIYSDVCNKEIKISGSNQSGALGAAIFGAIAAMNDDDNNEKNVKEMIFKLGQLKKDTVYKPIKRNVEIYEILFREYQVLYDYYGSNKNNVMKKLDEIKHNINNYDET